jgi:hypothetical protein
MSICTLIQISYASLLYFCFLIKLLAILIFGLLNFIVILRYYVALLCVWLSFRYFLIEHTGSSTFKVFCSTLLVSFFWYSFVCNILVVFFYHTIIYLQADYTGK